MPSLRTMARRLRLPLIHGGALASVASAGVPLQALTSTGDAVLLVVEVGAVCCALGGLLGGMVAWWLSRLESWQ